MRFFIFTLWTTCFTMSNALIVSMEEFYNAELNQTVILIDAFDSRIASDNVQHEALLEAVKKYRGAVLFQGMLPDVQAAENQPAIKFYQACLQNELSIKNVEFRTGWINMKRILDYGIYEYKTFNEIKTFFNSTEPKEPLFNFFERAGYDINKIKNELHDFTQKLGASKATHKKAKEIFEGDLKTVDTLYNEIHGSLPETYKNNVPKTAQEKEDHINSLVNSLIDDYLIEEKDSNQNSTIFLSTKCVIRKIEDISTLLSSMHIAKEVFQMNDKKIIFAYICHAPKLYLSEILLKSNYTSKTVIDFSKPFTDILQKLALSGSNRWWEEIASLFTSEDKLEQYSVNVADFFKKCSIK